MKKIHESKNSKKFNATINKVYTEMDSAKKYLGQWNLKWRETYSDVYCYDLQFKLEDDIAYMESMYDGLYDLGRYYDDSKREGQAIERVTLVDENDEEYVCEFRQLDWVVSNSKLARTFTFYNVGGIKYSQVKRKRNSDDSSYDYYAAYDVNDNSLAIRFVRCNEDLSLLYEGDKRVIESDGVQIVEDSNGIVLSTSLDDMRYTVKMDSANRIESKVLVDDGDTYIYCGTELVSATRSNEECDEELEITPELVSEVDKKLELLMIGKLNKYELLTFISNVKMRLSNAIKSVKNDVPLVGLVKRLDIALSMIGTKKVVACDKAVSKKKNK